ncbi:MAG: ribonuclease HI [Candidatus Kaiserbacteria bacterium]|nr:ribonuclease HI [Candidatus Kaiserbacteria bacterium]
MYMRYEVYTDGSCKGNPGPGGIGAVVYKDGAIDHTFSQGYYKTTNNRMELRAIIAVLEKYGDAEQVTVWTDSEYARKGITQWMTGWEKNGWQTANRRPVKNKDLWQHLHRLVGSHVAFRWIKGHSNEEGNETADSLATRASARGPFMHDDGF